MDKNECEQPNCHFTIFERDARDAAPLRYFFDFDTIEYFFCPFFSVSPLSKNVQVNKTHCDQYARVPKHGGSLSLFN
jgi:hypothetical protein